MSVVKTEVVMISSGTVEDSVPVSMAMGFRSVVKTAVVMSSEIADASVLVSDWLMVRVVSSNEETPVVEATLSVVPGTSAKVDVTPTVVDVSIVLELTLHGLAREPTMRDAARKAVTNVFTIILERNNNKECQDNKPKLQ